MEWILQDVIGVNFMQPLQDKIDLRLPGRGEEEELQPGWRLETGDTEGRRGDGAECVGRCWDGAGVKGLGSSQASEVEAFPVD